MRSIYLTSSLHVQYKVDMFFTHPIKYYDCHLWRKFKEVLGLQSASLKVEEHTEKVKNELCGTMEDNSKLLLHTDCNNRDAKIKMDWADINSN